MSRDYQFGVMKIVKIHGKDGYRTVWEYLMLQNSTLKNN